MPASVSDAFDEARAGQRAFRLLMDALARPGTIQTLSDRMPDVPAGVPPYLALVAFTLLDQEVRFVTSGPAEGTIAAYLARRTGARHTGPDDAGYLFGDGTEPVAVLSRLGTGSLEHPERGATAVLTVARVSEDRDEGAGWIRVGLRGPGVASARYVYVRGLAPANLDALAALNAEYPLGVDLFVIDAGGRILGLPRSAGVAWEAV